MRHLFHAVALSSLLFAGCSKENKINQNNASTTTIGPSGGIVDGPDGTELRVPGGAVTEDTEFGIAVAQPGEYPPLDTTWDVSGKVYAFTPHGFAFLTPAIVALPAGTGTTVITAERNGSWTEAGGDPAADMLETSVTHFSFFASASAADAGSPSATCSGRDLISGGPISTLALTGIVPASGPQPEVDASGLRSGYAVLEGSPAGAVVRLVFAPYDAACAHYTRGAAKIGAPLIEVSVQGSGAPVSVTDYTGQDVMGMVTGIAAGVQPGACTPNVGSGPVGGTGVVLSVMSLDGTVIRGTFTNLQVGSGLISGTFDVPFCVAPTNLNPPLCCIQ